MVTRGSTAGGPEVVHVGAAARDVTPTDARGWRLGGGVTYAALTTARLGIATGAVIGVDEQASRAVELDTLRAAGVEVLPVPLEEGPIFENIERPTGRVQTCLATGRPLPVPADLPAAWRAAAWSVVPVAGEIEAAWLAAMPATAWLVVGWQGFLRRLAAGERVERVPPRADGWIARADLVGVSQHDLGDEVDLDEASLRHVSGLLKPGADLIVTGGAEGGRHVRVAADGTPVVSAYGAVASGPEVDATGAGDTFLAALVASALRADLRAAASATFDLRFAAAAASLVVEDHGLAGVPDLAAVRARLAVTSDVSRSMPGGGRGPVPHDA
ncbi:MAG TPA: PfkB family carbohydrate kinase [Candidatus Limnocylindrales bacterium]